MSILTEGPRTGAYIADEASINLSRKVVVIASGEGKLAPGTVLGKVTSSGEYAALDHNASDGSQIAAAVLFDAVDATSAAVEAVVSAALTAVNESELIWPAGINSGEKASAIAALSAHHIEVLSATPAAPTIGATTLVFAALPSTAEENQDIGPVQVRIENDEGLLVIGDNTTSVALAKSSGPGTMTTTSPVTAVNGIATFTEVSFDTDGSVVITASAAGLASAVSEAIEITDPA